MSTSWEIFGRNSSNMPYVLKNNVRVAAALMSTMVYR